MSRIAPRYRAELSAGAAYPPLRADEWWDGPCLCSIDYEVIFFFSEGRAPFVTVGTVSVEVNFHSRAGDRRVTNVVSKGQTSHSTRSPVVEGGGRGCEEAVIA